MTNNINKKGLGDERLDSSFLVQPLILLLSLFVFS